MNLTGLPNFLGIGVPRAGTTWLHELLAAHPAAFVPSRRKEIYFFDLHYHRGLRWYRKFFPPAREATRYRAIGEITPFYLYGDECPQRIATVPVDRLILMLRNPVDRAWSYYGHMSRNGAFWGSFEEFLERPAFGAIEHGHYGAYIRRYLKIFRREQILTLVFEEAMADVKGTKRRIASFLDLDLTGFPEEAGSVPVYTSVLPKARRAYGLAFGASRVLRRLNLDFIVNEAKRRGIKQAFGTGERPAPMTEETRQSLRKEFATTVDEVEELLQLSLGAWRH